MISSASRHEVGITTSIWRDISCRRLWPKLDVIVGFLIQSISTLEGLNQLGDDMPMLSRLLTQPFAMVSTMVSPRPEQRLVLVIETKDIVPLDTSSNALRIVQEYGHLLLPFLKESHVPALSQWMTNVERPYY